VTEKRDYAMAIHYVHRHASCLIHAARRTTLADWVAPKGHEICAESSCDKPARNGETSGSDIIWQCKPGDGCEGEGRGCYVCVVLTC
jgi:hypothetical protein